MGEYTIEEMIPAHLERVLAIYNYYVQNTTVTFHAHPLTMEEMSELVFYANPKYKAFVIRLNDTICGYMIITQHKKREAYERTAEVTIYLQHDCLGHGLGQEGLKYLEEYAKNKRFHVLIASICGQNERSIGLFEKLGYFKCAHYKEVGVKFGQLLDVVAYQKII